MLQARDDVQALYSADIRGWARKVRADRRLVPADASISRVSRTCGSTVTLDVRYEGETITALGYHTRSCTLGMATTAVMVQLAPGRSFQEIDMAGQMLTRLLAGEDVRFPSDWEVLAMLAAARAFPSRHGAILLPFDILQRANFRTAPAADT
jgi:NifU-like protein involved in Fe-S cluster formation